MLATVGERDFYTANIAYKVAKYFIHLALDIWSVDPSAYKNEIARTTFLKGKLFEITGRVASRLRKEITKED
ncbi:hypothetical protein N7540_012956 [Penicillium herquei]|nr:hypothetical protein N7540_012956 [Penicillium herquei]